MKNVNINPKEYKKYRAEHFIIEVETGIEFFTKQKEIHLSISFNGRQFTSISFTKKEWMMIKKTVNEISKTI